MGGSDTSLNSFKREKEENYRRNESQKNYKILKKKKKAMCHNASDSFSA